MKQVIFTFVPCKQLFLTARRAVEVVANHLQIFPGLAFLRRIAQQVGGMESGHDFDPTKISEFSAYATNAFALFQKVSERGVTHYNDYFGLNRGNLAK